MARGGDLLPQGSSEDGAGPVGIRVSQKGRRQAGRALGQPVGLQRGR